MATEKEQVSFAQAVKNLRDTLPAMLEWQALQARLQRARFEALVREGFTAEQALYLVKEKP
jgi:hypothetical protein